LTGRELKRYQFRAELWDENDTLVRTASNSDSGTFTFSALNFTQDDVRSEPYVYTIKETKRTLGGYTFDESVYTVSISVLDNGDGTLTIVPTYKDSDNHELPGPPTFENEYHAEGSVTLKAWKQLKGRALTPGEFSFEILDEDGERVGNVATNDENGEIVFDAIPFDETDVGKTYKYVVHEVAGNDTAVNYSDEAYGYTVIVYDNGDGTLSFAQDTASATVGEPRRLRWDEVPEESRADYIWYDPSWQRFNFWCSFDKWGAVNEDNGHPMPHTEYSDQALARGAAVMSDALNVSVTATDFDTYFGNQGQGPARDLKANAVVRLHDTLVEAFPWFGLYADSHAMTVDFRGINPTGQNSNLVAFNTETVDIDIDDESGTVPVFTNTLKPGSLSIEKHVSDVPDEHSGDTFRFHVKLTGEGSGDIDSLEYVHEQID
jgi:pilin isopeptide linkage protein